MNGLLLVLFGGLAVAVIFAYLGGRQAGLGRGEQDRGDLAEENIALRKYAGGLEERVTAQHHRIVAMTAWETMPWTGLDRHPSLVPVQPEAQPVPALLAAPEARIPRPRPRPRERRTSTAAFLNPGEGAIISGQHVTADDPIDYGQWQDGKPWHTPTEHDCPPDLCPHTPSPMIKDLWWREIEDEIWAAKTWLATL